MYRKALYGSCIFLVICVVLVMSIPASSQEKLPPIETVETGPNRELVVNGEAFFPLMSWLQAPEVFPLLRSLGFNTFCGNQKGVSALRQCMEARKCGGYAVVHYDPEAVGDQGMLAWIHGDEPDMPRKAKNNDESSTDIRYEPKTDQAVTSEMFRTIRSGDNSKRPVFMTCTAYFMDEFTNRYTALQKERYYPAFLKSCDVAGFDIYPVYGWNQAAWLNYPSSGTSQLVELTDGKPVYAWIETSKGSKWVDYEIQLDVLPVHTRYEVWGAIISGATAIGYFTHSWQPDFKEFSPTEEMQRELKRLNSQIARLAPAILAPLSSRKVSMTIENGLSCHCKVTRHRESLYLFAQISDLGENIAEVKQHEMISPRGGEAHFQVDGLKKGAVIEVVDEDRTITASEGGFEDSFDPLAEHIYRIDVN